MKEIPLTQGQVAIVDNEDFKELSKYKWQPSWRLNKCYAKRGEYINKKQVTIYMHRQILKITDNSEVDHIDNNGLNNQKCNLRICNRSQNQRNKNKTQNSCSSNWKGVALSSGQRRKKWMAYISINKKRKYIGRFSSEIDAAKAYNKEALKIFGKFALLNNIG